MSNPCDVVAERIALGEPLGDLADHAATCARCRGLVALPTELGALKREADPGLGFSARVTAGAQHRFIVRRRRRIATAAISATAATVLVTFALTRTPPSAETTPSPATATQPTDPTDPWKTGNDAGSAGDADDDARALVRLADTDRSMQFRANWKAITKPLHPYRTLVKGAKP